MIVLKPMRPRDTVDTIRYGRARNRCGAAACKHCLVDTVDTALQQRGGDFSPLYGSYRIVLSLGIRFSIRLHGWPLIVRPEPFVQARTSNLPDQMQ